MSTVSGFGPFRFVQMQPPPPYRRIMGHVEARVGVNDYSFWQEATRGYPWQFEAFATVDPAQKHALMRLYEASIFTGPYDLYWANQTYTTEKVIPLSMVPVEISDVVAGIGGIAPYWPSGTPTLPGTSIVRTRWEAIVTYVPTPP